jgi:hypothetical protein
MPRAHDEFLEDIGYMYTFHIDFHNGCVCIGTDAGKGYYSQRQYGGSTTGSRFAES